MRILFTSTISILIIMVLLWTRPDTYAELQILPPPTVNISIVEKIDIQPITEVTGKFQPARKARLHFQVSGQIDRRFVEAGQYVTENSKLLSIDSGDFIDAVEESIATLKTEDAAIERDSRLLELMRQERKLQEKEVLRIKQLGRDSLASKSNYDQTLQTLYRQQAEETRLEHSVGSAQNRFKIEQVRLNKAERNLKRAHLMSPFDGTVNALYVEVGDYVSPGEPALEIVQVDELDMSLEITMISAVQLQLGQEIQVITNSGERKGKIISLTVAPDAETNTHTLKIRLPSYGLFSGQLAVAKLPGVFYEAANTIPISAILYEDGQSYVFEVINDRVIKKTVKLIERYKDIQIISGIESGSIIISKDVSSLADGQIIIIP